MFDLKQPCVNCPFRKGQGERFLLSPARLDEIFNAPAFQCHKTVDYGASEDDGRAGDHPQQCAGLMAVLYRAQIPNQIMQVAERLGHLDLTQIDPKNEAYSSLDEALSAHGHYDREPHNIDGRRKR